MTAINDSVLVAIDHDQAVAPGLINGLSTDKKTPNVVSVVYFPPDAAPVTEWVHLATDPTDAQTWIEAHAEDAALERVEDVLKWHRVCWPAKATPPRPGARPAAEAGAETAATPTDPPE